MNCLVSLFNKYIEFKQQEREFLQKQIEQKRLQKLNPLLIKSNVIEVFHIELIHFIENEIEVVKPVIQYKRLGTDKQFHLISQELYDRIKPSFQLPCYMIAFYYYDNEQSIITDLIETKHHY